MKKSFDELFEDQTKYGTKVKTDEYHDSGTHIIVDQGQEQVAGYTDREDGIFTSIPAIIFGDHTRVIKYVAAPFFLGADGVKVLRCRFSDANYKYLYYALKNARIPNTGYNRHFKWLRETSIPYPSADKQTEVVHVLDEVTGIIQKRQQQLSALDDLIKARFVELFGDPVSNSKGWDIRTWDAVFETRTGKLDSNASVEGGEYPFFTCAKEWLWIDKYAYDCEALLLAGNNAAGVYDVKHYKGKFNAYQRTYILKLKDKNWSYSLFKYQLEDRLQYLQSQSKGTNTRYLTMGILNSLAFIIPPKAMQDAFAAFVSQVDKSKFAVKQSLEETQKLFDSLMQKYFE